MARNRVMGLVLVMALGGCGRLVASEFVATRPRPGPVQPRPGDQVELFMADRPARAYVEVGLVEVQESRGTWSSAELLAALRARGGQEGCDGLLFLGDNDSIYSGSSTTTETTTTKGTSQGSPPKTSSQTTASTYTDTRQGYRASCVIYTATAVSAP